MSFFQNLFGHKEAQDAHYQMYGNDQPEYQHKSSLTHEFIAGAAGFAAMKAYEDHVRRTGEQVSHPMMKEMLAGFAAAEVDKLFETKGIDYLDREKAKRMATQQAHQLAHEKYGPGGVYSGDGFQGQNPNSYDQGYGGGNYGNQGYGGGNDGNQGYGGGNYGNQGFNDYQQQQPPQQQQQQWDGGFQQPPPEHHRHHHHHREEYDD